MIPSFEQRHSPGHRLCPGISSSRSATSALNQTENRDMRVVGGEGSSNISANDSDVTVISTDHGAVNAGLTLGSQALEYSASTTSDALSAAKSFFTGALSSVTQSQQAAVGAVSVANERLASAYQSGQQPEQTNLKYAGFVVVGLAAVMLLSGLKK